MDFGSDFPSACAYYCASRFRLAFWQEVVKGSDATYGVIGISAPEQRIQLLKHQGVLKSSIY